MPPCNEPSFRHSIADPADPYRLTDQTRSIGLIVCRGSTVMLVSPEDGFEEIENPFADVEEDDEGPAAVEEGT